MLQAIGERLPATIELWSCALAAAIVLGAIFGLAHARVRGTPLGDAVLALILLLRATPVFLAALLLQLAWMFARLPVAGMASREGFDVGDRLSHLVLPVVALAVPFGAWSACVFDEFYRRVEGTARIISVRRLVPSFAATVALIGPVLLAGTITIEPAFAWPGIARLLFNGFESSFELDAVVIVMYVTAVALLHLIARPWRSRPDREAPPRSAPLLRSWLTVLGLAVCIVLVVVALGANLFAPFDPNYIDLAHWQGYPLAPGVAGHPLGTEENGRDLLSRLVFAIRNSLGIAILATVFATTIGIVIAKVTQRLSWFGNGAALAVSGIRSFAWYPILLAAVWIVALSFTVKALNAATLALIVGAVSWPAVVTAIRNGRSARSLAAVAFSVTAGTLLLEATLSSQGFGVQPPAPSLGNMLVNAQANLFVAPWVVVAPAVTIVAALFALNAVGDKLRA